MGLTVCAACKCRVSLAVSLSHLNALQSYSFFLILIQFGVKIMVLGHPHPDAGATLISSLRL